MTLPISPVVMPADLAGQENGKLPATMLADVGPSGRLHHLAARAFIALRAACAEQGLPLTYTYGGTYRSYAAQEALFLNRYSKTGTGGGCKTWNGERWCKKSSNLATAATPGTSNHGWGLAIDTAFDSDVSDGIGPDDAAGITGHPKWKWFLANAERFGFSWELQSEPWHIRYVTGDNIPQAVLDYEQPIAPPPDPTPPPQEEDMAFIAIVTNEPTNPVRETWLESTGVHLTHIVDGNAANVFVRAGQQQVRVEGADELRGLLKSVVVLNDCPSEWKGTAWETLWNSRKPR